MIDKVKAHLEEVEQFNANTPEAVEDFRIKYAGKKGILNDLFASFREVKNEDKKAYGQVLNELKSAVAEKVEILKAGVNGNINSASGLDLTRPGYPTNLGSQHPLTLVKTVL